jgi:hypothetical protein
MNSSGHLIPKLTVNYEMNLFSQYSNHLRRGNFFRSLLGISGVLRFQSIIGSITVLP